MRFDKKGVILMRDGGLELNYSEQEEFVARQDNHKLEDIMMKKAEDVRT